MVDSCSCLDWVVPEGMSQVWRRSEVGNPKRAILSYSPFARSVEDETWNGDRKAKRNTHRNHETVVLGLFSLENLKRAIKVSWFRLGCRFAFRSPFRGYLTWNGCNTHLCNTKCNLLSSQKWKSPGKSSGTKSKITRNEKQLASRVWMFLGILKDREEATILSTECSTPKDSWKTLKTVEHQ